MKALLQVLDDLFHLALPTLLVWVIATLGSCSLKETYPYHIHDTETVSVVVREPINLNQQR